jgi:hypothetical protein
MSCYKPHLPSCITHLVVHKVLPCRDCCKLHLGFEISIFLPDIREICCFVHRLTTCESFGHFEECVVIKRK